MSLRFLVSLFLLCLFSRDRLQMAEPRFPRFGGVSGTNSSQFMDLVSVTFVSGLMSDSYTAITSSSGVLTVTSGGTAVAKINLVGSDALEFPSGQIVLVTRLVAGQHATVLQLPASTRDHGGAKESAQVSSAGRIEA
jgi:hypothetical protein